MNCSWEIRENDHLTYLGVELAHHGIEPTRKLVVRDHPDDIRSFFASSWSGPTLL